MMSGKPVPPKNTLVAMRQTCRSSVPNSLDRLCTTDLELEHNRGPVQIYLTGVSGTRTDG